MKKMMMLFAIAAMAVSCKTSVKGVESTNWLGKKVVMSSVLPENGIVTATREFEKGLNLDGFAELYPQDIFKPETVLVKYEFNRNQSEDIYADDFYKEDLYLEIPTQAFKKEYKDAAMQDVKLIYGKHCYCKGEAGYYKITDGILKINHKEEATTIKLSFKSPVTSVIENVEFTVE